jgi:hypothetical protein
MQEPASEMEKFRSLTRSLLPVSRELLGAEEQREKSAKARKAAKS